MDSSRKRTLISISIMTLVFLIVSVVSVYYVFNNDAEKPVNKDYISVLEKELNVDLSDDDYIAINKNGYETLVKDKKYSTYTSPCFDFVIDDGKALITRALSKEFYDYNFAIGDEIVKINDTDLNGLSYFEIEELIYAKEYGKVKQLTLSSGETISYEYKKYTYYSIVEEETNVTLSIYNLDRINRKTVCDLVEGYEEVTIDLSQATVTTLDALTDFISIFANDNVVLFSSPEGIYSYKTYKLNNLKINIGNNKDLGILFTVTSIKNHNNTIIFDVDSNALNTLEFNTKKVLSSSSFDVIIYNVKVEAIENNSNEISGLCK